MLQNTRVAVHPAISLGLKTHFKKLYLLLQFE